MVHVHHAVPFVADDAFQSLPQLCARVVVEVAAVTGQECAAAALDARVINVILLPPTGPKGRRTPPSWPVRTAEWVQARRAMPSGEREEGPRRWGCPT